MGWMLAVFAIRYLVNQVVLGVVLNVFAAGLTGFFYDAFMQPHVESLNQPALLDPINIPLLQQHPGRSGRCSSRPTSSSTSPTC